MLALLLIHTSPTEYSVLHAYCTASPSRGHLASGTGAKGEIQDGGCTAVGFGLVCCGGWLGGLGKERVDGLVIFWLFCYVLDWIYLG